MVSMAPQTGSLVELYEMGTAGAVLVRPDGHVAWRTSSRPADSSRNLVDFLRTHWSQYYLASRSSGAEL